MRHEVVIEPESGMPGRARPVMPTPQIIQAVRLLAHDGRPMYCDMCGTWHWPVNSLPRLSNPR